MFQFSSSSAGGYVPEGYSPPSMQAAAGAASTSESVTVRYHEAYGPYPSMSPYTSPDVGWTPSPSPYNPLPVAYTPTAGRLEVQLSGGQWGTVSACCTHWAAKSRV